MPALFRPPPWSPGLALLLSLAPACPSAPLLCVDADADGWLSADSDAGCSARPGDCDDADGTIHPGAEEACDQVDNDCDAEVDEASVETCDGEDNDCDGIRDDGLGDPRTFWGDADADGFGSASAAVEAVCQPAGHVDNHADCDDADPTRDFVERCGDGVDNDCRPDTPEEACDIATCLLQSPTGGFLDNTQDLSVIDVNADGVVEFYGHVEIPGLTDLVDRGWGDLWEDTFVDGVYDGLARPAALDAMETALLDASDLEVELGFGSVYSDPATDWAWTWEPATWNPACTTCDGDDDADLPPTRWEFVLPVDVSATPDLLRDRGCFALAFRFVLDGTTICHGGWPGPGYDPTAPWILSMGGACLDWANLQYLSTSTSGSATSLEATLGDEVQAFGQVRDPTAFCTDGTDASSLQAEVGASDEDTHPASWPASVWTPGTFNVCTSDRTEYKATWTPPATGTWHVAWRFSQDDGATWTYAGTVAGAAIPEAPYAGETATVVVR